MSQVMSSTNKVGPWSWNENASKKDALTVALRRDANK